MDSPSSASHANIVVSSQYFYAREVPGLREVEIFLIPVDVSQRNVAGYDIRRVWGCWRFKWLSRPPSVRRLDWHDAAA